jgi:hypothetical protein
MELSLFFFLLQDKAQASREVALVTVVYHTVTAFAVILASFAVAGAFFDVAYWAV